MTWGDLEQIVDTSDLSLRNYAVLKAFTKHVNPPTAKRPYPENCIVWPSMEVLMDLARGSRDMVQRAKHALVAKNILELVASAGRGRTPRYRINEQKIQRDEAALERQAKRRARRHTGQRPPERVLPKGSQKPEPSLPKGSQNTPPEVFPGSKREPKNTNFLDAPSPALPPPEKKSGPRSPSTSKTQTPAPLETAAPPDIPITPNLEAWRDAHAPSLDLQHAIRKFLLYARAKGKTNTDWEAAFCFYTENGIAQQARQNGQRPGVGPVERPPGPAPDPTAIPTPKTCSWGGCDAPPCPHHQACAYHAGCESCRATLTPEASPGPALPMHPFVDTPAAPLANLPPEGPASEITPPAEVQALVQGFLQGHMMPTTSLPLAPLGSLPRRETEWTPLLERCREDDQPIFRASKAAREARVAQRQPAMAAD